MGPSAQHHHPQESKWANSRHAVGEENNSKELSTHAKEKQDWRCSKGWKWNKQHWWDINSKNGLMLSWSYGETCWHTAWHMHTHRDTQKLFLHLLPSFTQQQCWGMCEHSCNMIASTAQRLSNTAVTNQKRDYCFCYQAV